MEQFDEIESIDDVADRLNWDIDDGQEGIEYDIPPETEFFGHCSNLQAWYEHQYDTNLLHSSLSFPLLRKLADVGDKLAQKVFREEIAKRFHSRNPTVMNYLLNEGYLDYLDVEERFDYLLEGFEYFEEDYYYEYQIYTYSHLIETMKSSEIKTER